MNERTDIERVLTAWFDDGPTVMPERVTIVVADRIGRQRQRRRWRLDWRHPATRPLMKGALAVVAVVVIGLIGFGLLRGGDGFIVGTPAASPSPSATVAPSSASPATTPAPTVTPSASAQPGVTGARDLMTTEEAAQAVHVTGPLEARSLQHVDLAFPVPFKSATCAFVRDNTALFVLGYNKENGADTFAIWKRASGVEAVSGVADGAVWDPIQTTLYVLKGNHLVTIEPIEPKTSTLTLEAAKAIAAFLIPRM